jgi:uncharacterized SAM-binding protein YcdF (DUF218 family)
VVVLGCAVRLDERGRLAPGALSRRLDAAAEAYERMRAEVSREGNARRLVVVVSGGRRWGAAIEADVMARELSQRGVPESVIVRERCSLSTSGNARFSAAILSRRGIARATVVTCAWHVPRAMGLFSVAGVEPHPVWVQDDGPVGWRSRLWRWGRERFLRWVDLAPGRRSQP